MEARVTVLTLGVKDLEKSVSFYRDGLGLPTEGIIGREFEHGAVAFFDLAGGLKLALWSQVDVAHDTGLPLDPPSSTSFTIGHNVSTKEEVDAVTDAAGRAGAEIVKARRQLFTAATLAISVIWTDIYGMSFGTLTCLLPLTRTSNIYPLSETAVPINRMFVILINGTASSALAMRH